MTVTVGLRQAGLTVAILGRTPAAEKRLTSGFRVTTPDGRQKNGQSRPC